MDVAPFSVACTTASIIALVPFEKFSNSNTPGGLGKEIPIVIALN